MLQRIRKMSTVFLAAILLALSFWYGGKMSRRYEERIILAYSEAKEDAVSIIEKARDFLEKELDLRVSSEG